MTLSRVAVTLLAALGAARGAPPSQPARPLVVEATIADLQSALREGRTTCRLVVRRTSTASTPTTGALG